MQFFFLLFPRAFYTTFFRYEEGEISTQEIALGADIEEDGALEDLAPIEGLLSPMGKKFETFSWFFQQLWLISFLSGSDFGFQ